MLERAEPLIESGYVVVKRCRHGYIAYNQFDTVIGKSLHYYGEWCEGELDLLGEVLAEGDVVLDIGANIGTHTLFFAAKVGQLGRVLAFEPQRLFFQLLCGNSALNAFTNIDCRQAAVGDAAGTITVPVFDPYLGTNYGGVSVEGHRAGEPVAVTTVDALALSHCALLKIDVEGMEVKALQGAAETIRRCRPIIFVENNTVERSSALIKTLDAFHYDCWWHFCPYYNPANFFGYKVDELTDPVFRHRYEPNMLCFPKERNVKVPSLLPVTGSHDDFLQAKKRGKL